MPELWMMALKSLAMLCIVLGVMIGVLYLLKRFYYSHGIINDRKLIREVSSHYLAPKERVVLIEVMGERLLLGVTPQNISYLTKIDTETEGQDAE
jgi:flagellar protein FliO/FliZ